MSLPKTYAEAVPSCFSNLRLPMLEKLFLLVTVATLPAFEAPKNIAVVMYAIFWLVNRWRARDWGGRWSGMDLAVLFFVGAAYASTIFGGFSPDKGVAAANHVLVTGCIFLMLRRSRFQSGFLRLLLVVAIVSTLLTLAYGYWGLIVTHERSALGLHSVGHVNHSAIYVGLSFVIALASLSFAPKNWFDHLFFGISTGVLLISLFVMAARGVLVPVVVFSIGWLVFVTKNRKLRFVVLSGSFAVLCLGLFLFPAVIEKTKGGISTDQIGSYRPALAKVALLAAEQYPIFGVGITNFSKISPRVVDEWNRDRHERVPEGDLFFTTHAHNVYFNSLAEQGVVGLVALVILFGAWLFELWRARLMPMERTKKILWGAALGAWVIIVLGGLFNTTFHHENALLASIIMGLFLSEKSLHDEPV